jgi:hypothetical protein
MIKVEQDESGYSYGDQEETPPEPRVLPLFREEERDYSAERRIAEEKQR